MYFFQLAEISWWYFMSKIVDLAETLFYVVEKRFHLITIYHVVHHSIMLFVWLGVKYVPGKFNIKTLYSHYFLLSSLYQVVMSPFLLGLIVLYTFSFTVILFLEP